MGHVIITTAILVVCFLVNADFVGKTCSQHHWNIVVSIYFWFCLQSKVSTKGMWSLPRMFFVAFVQFVSKLFFPKMYWISMDGLATLCQDDFESHRPPSTPAPTTPALPTPLRPPPLRPPAVPAPYHTDPLRYRPPTEAILCEYSDCMYTQLLKLRYWISSPVKMIHVQYPKVNSITKKYFMEMNDRLQNLSILLHFRKIKYIDSKESWWTILYLIVWYEPLSCRWHSYAWPK